ncbi:uncharacterized protein TRIADDRAFT_28157 [Trichoplax adhaerens]|uniref:G-protein coupled receptors family 1 profile domain-containing protein n=1 Tax=Trichoplax adhaerens TaxID=10228 RepID=B3S334_TRIAD|nr:hypothetical protein TRIADDRAFT_28157 [Trichoplax adhaerens]EDV22897.1 hypothetical protein TRIADDRAFT_28157 [Trichoplax adhaerens]|eukprot:XP_002114763.1 hypothetical protein TRIADDRAFT_28157 [Trichoplax adhaerens]
MADDHAIVNNSNLPLGNAIIRSSVYCLLFITGFFGNLIFLVIFAKCPYMRIPINYFLVNLAIVDITATIFRELALIIGYFNCQWLYNYHTCNLFGFMRNICCAVTIFTLLAISVCRYLVICQHKGRRMTRHAVLCIIAFVWFYTILVCLCPIFGWNRYIYHQNQYVCSIDWSYQPSYIRYIIIVDVFLPTIITIICYTFIYIVVHRHSRRIQDILRMSGSLSSAQYNRIAREKKVTKIMFAVYINFLICYLPFSIITAILIPSGIKPPAELFFVGTFMIDLNSSINPMLYPFIYRRCKEAYCEVLCCHRSQTSPTSNCY